MAGDHRLFQSQEIRALTGVRGAAALFVVAYHLDLGQANIGPAQHLLHHGYLAVDLFFVLSGFVLALTSRAMVEGAVSWSALKAFLGRRIARIYPLYLFTVILYLLHLGGPIAAPEWSTAYWRLVIANLFLVQAWGVSVSLNGVAWSVSTEWLSYLAFPLLVWFTLRGSAWRSVLVGAAGGCVLLALALLPPVGPVVRGLHGGLSIQGPLDYADPTSLGPLLRCVPEFTLGLLSFGVARSGFAAGLLRHPIFGVGVLLLAGGLLTIKGADLAVVAMLPLVVLVLATDAGPAAWLFKTKQVHWLGVLSYGIYLLHPLILWPWLDDLRLMLNAEHVPMVRPIVILIAYSATLIAASLGYRFIERPAREALRKIL